MRLEPGAVLVVDPAGLARGLSAIPDQENALLRLADGRRTLAEIARVSGRASAEVEATLLRLVDAGVLRVADPPAAGGRLGATPGPDGADWFAHPSGEGGPGRGDRPVARPGAPAPAVDRAPAVDPAVAAGPQGGTGRVWGLAAALLLFVVLLAVPLRARWSAPPPSRPAPQVLAPSRPPPGPDVPAPPALHPTEPAPSAAWVAAMAEAGDRLRSGDAPRAAAACREAVRLEPANAAGWIALGEASGAAGDRETARAAFERYLSLEPDGRRAAEARAALERLRP